MTRVASGAQRSGAATHIIICVRADGYYALPSDYFASSFFAARTPARWERKRLWARPGWHGRSGSPVPNGSGGGTAKRLKFNGSTVLFRDPSRDARTSAAACAYTRNHQNHRTTEPPIRNGRNQPFLTADAVLWRFCRSGADIKWGGYSLRSFAASASPDQGLDRGAARGKFWRRVRLAGVTAGPIGAGEVAGRNGGFPPFFGVPIGHVGIRVSECGRKIETGQCFTAVLRQPARLAAASTATPPGCRLAAEGGTPPSRAAISSSSMAQPIFQVSADLRIRGLIGQRSDRRRALISSVKMGSGDRRSAGCQSIHGARALNGIRQRRVGVMGAILGWGQTRERSTLWGGSTRVN